MLAGARKAQPVFYAPEFDLWVVTRYDDILAVVRDEEHVLSSAGALKSSPDAAYHQRCSKQCSPTAGPTMPYIIELDPPLHDRIRGLVARAFTPRRIAELEPRIEAIAIELVDELAPLGRADVIEKIAGPLPLRVPRAAPFPARGPRPGCTNGGDWLRPGGADRSWRRTGRSRARGTPALHASRPTAGARSRDDLVGALTAARVEDDDPMAPEAVAGLPSSGIAGLVTLTSAIGKDLHLSSASLTSRRCWSPGRTACDEEILRLSRMPRGSSGSRPRTNGRVELGGAA